MMLISETILSNLPLIILIWTGITLSWGVYLSTVLSTMIRFARIHKGGSRVEDRHCLNCVNASNALLTLYLFVAPIFVVPFGDAIIVINIFLNTIYIKYTVDVARWYHSKSNYEQRRRNKSPAQAHQLDV